MVDASVVIACRNGAATLREQLAGLSRQNFAGTWEVILADNGSTDSSVQVFESFRAELPSLRVVDASRSAGICVARNDGSEAAKGRVLCYADVDDIVDRKWLGRLVAAATAADLVGGRLDHARLNSPRVARRRDPDFAVAALPVSARFLPYAVGANLAIRKTTLDAVGGWDESFKTCGDDIDLSWRVQLAGGSLRFEPGAIVHYRHREDLRGFLQQQRNYGAARIQLHRKHGAAGMPAPSLRGHIWRLAADSIGLATPPYDWRTTLSRVQRIAFAVGLLTAVADQ